MELLHALATHAAVAIEKQNLYEENEKFFRSIVKVLAAAVDARDPVTAGHSERVAKYSANLARVRGYTGDRMRLVEYAAYLHDVGKIGVPDAILNKPGRLDPDEYEKMKSHAVRTNEILSEGYFPRGLRTIPEIAGSHHEKLDGSGYPKGLRGEDMDEITRIMAITDIYDALVAQDRPYKPALPRLKAFQILREEADKGHLDSELVELFIREKQYEID
jgi:HD-GYP domain-containing protein (c-di-GMP phosphodiesterase class II)